MSIDYNTIAALASGVVAVFGLAKYAVPASRKLGQIDQVIKDASADTSTADKLVTDVQQVVSAGSVTAAQLQTLQADAVACSAAFKKTVSDVKAAL